MLQAGSERGWEQCYKLSVSDNIWNREPLSKQLCTTNCSSVWTSCAFRFSREHTCKCGALCFWTSMSYSLCESSLAECSFCGMHNVCIELQSEVAPASTCKLPSRCVNLIPGHVGGLGMRLEVYGSMRITCLHVKESSLVSIKANYKWPFVNHCRCNWSKWSGGSKEQFDWIYQPSKIPHKTISGVVMYCMTVIHSHLLRNSYDDAILYSPGPRYRR